MNDNEYCQARIEALEKEIKKLKGQLRLAWAELEVAEINSMKDE